MLSRYFSLLVALLGFSKGLSAQQRATQPDRTPQRAEVLVLGTYTWPIPGMTSST